MNAHGKYTVARTFTCTHMFMRAVILVCMTSISRIHTEGTHFFSCIVCLPLRHTLSFSHTHTHTHKRCTTLSVLEFYILMKEEARRPIKAVGAGRDHLSADSRVVRRQFDGALSGPWLPALPSGVPSSAGDWWYDPPGWIRTPPLCLPLFCQC